MAYRDLRDFISQLEARGELKRVSVPVDPNLEMTEMCDRVLKAGGPALLFERPKGAFRAPGGGEIRKAEAQSGLGGSRTTLGPRVRGDDDRTIG